MSTRKVLSFAIMTIVISLGLISHEAMAGKLEKLAALALILKAQQGQGGHGGHHHVPVFIGGGGGGGGHHEKKQTVKIIHIHGETHGHGHEGHGHEGHDFGGHEW